ncbi:MAG: HyaD/HybD family hydrogenase maturation endopeptidase [Myxococcaceae bacterium]|nr:HyaD/HybD family hydrogenase maturation endopeptidase [Myxococcaceae bacterium]
MSGVVVLGVGNVLMSDEGVGVHAVGELERRFDFPPGVRLVDGGTSTHELLGDLEDLDHLIVIDAVSAGREPAALVRLEGDAVPAAFTTRLSPHQAGIADLLATLKLLGREPRHVVLYGVEPKRLTLDLSLSSEVARALPGLCARVVAELERLGASPVPRS